MSIKQPYGIKYQLPDGSGVVLEPCCVTCDAMDDNISSSVCPVCRCLYCTTTCYGPHVAACEATHPEETLRWKSSDAYKYLVAEAIRMFGPRSPKAVVPRPSS